MPSAQSLADEGIKASAANNAGVAVEKLTLALKERRSPIWLIERSKAYLKLKPEKPENAAFALKDAEQALDEALKRGNRQQMIEAQLRRSVIFYRLKRYADADCCAFWAIQLCDGAKSMEDDGQQSKVDGNGDYAVKLEDVQEAPPPKADISSVLGGSDSMQQGVNNKKERKQAKSWRQMAVSQLQQLPQGDPAKKVNVVKYEKVDKNWVDHKPVESKKEAPVSQKAEAPLPTETPEQRWDFIWKQYQALRKANEIRADYYQSDTALTISLFAKNVSKNELKVGGEDDLVTLSPVPNTFNSIIRLLLWDKIKPSETKCTVKSMKIELILQKATPGKWPKLRRDSAELFDNLALGQQTTFASFKAQMNHLGYSDPDISDVEKLSGDPQGWYSDLMSKAGNLDPLSTAVPEQDKVTKQSETVQSVSSTTIPDSSPNQAKSADTDTTEAKTTPNPSSETNTSAAHSYPTSSKTGPKNWDTFKDDEDDEKNDGVEDFFKKLYKDADEDTRRAMMKSYVESNGTSLSTSWSEAKSKTYETAPPDGAEAKKW